MKTLLSAFYLIYLLYSMSSHHHMIASDEDMEIMHVVVLAT